VHAQDVAPENDLRERMTCRDDALRLLSSDSFRATGGTHGDWDTYDRAMAEERRAAVLIAPRRGCTNPQAS
jgi:hypothetical protein